MPWVDGLLAWAPWLGMALALLAIAGLPHAFNIIDGYNGLAGMVALIVCLALAYVALQVGDRALAALLLSTAAATGGFWRGTIRAECCLPAMAAPIFAGVRPRTIAANRRRH